MEVAGSLKRQRPIALKNCIICQEEKRDKLLSSTDKGLSTLQDAAHSRKSFQDPNNRFAIDRITSMFDANREQSMVWHRSCYASFTSKAHILRLSKPAPSTVTSASLEHEEAGPSSRPPSRSCRSSTGAALDWEACIFCQDTSTKGKLSSVTTFKMSDQILEASKYDQKLSVHLAGIIDLIASEGKYHVSCFVKFTRQASKAKEQCKNIDLAMQWLIQELNQAAKKAHVLELSEVWKRYRDLAETAGLQIPQSFISRRASFKEKLAREVADVYDFITIKKRQTLIVPVKFQHSAIYNLVMDDNEDISPINVHEPSEDGFLEMVHLALKLRSDILAHPVYKGFVIDEDNMLSCVPESLFMFLRLMFGGQALLEMDQEDNEQQDKESRIQTKILSIAQDLVYNISGGKHWTPKHLGLASTLHQATRSKELVQIFHNAGHVISYDNILQVDSALAKKTLDSMDPVTGAVTPPNFIPGRFVHFTCDNIDINDTSFDGKNSFHATQVAAWQRGPEADMGLQNINPSTSTTLQVPAVMEELTPALILEGKAEPKSTDNTEMEWFSDGAENQAAVQAQATDMTFFMHRQADMGIKSGWTNFNQKISENDQEITSVGYMPIVQAPAHELDTLNTVVQRCKHVATALGQNYIVLTVDEALFGKLLELKWTKEEYSGCLVVRLGGLHTSLNFLKVIGQHMQSSGLLDVWVESQALGPRTAEQVLAGKSYARGMRAHKLTVQALWRILMPQLQQFIQQEDPQLHSEIQDKSSSDNWQALVTLLATPRFREVMDRFVASNENPNFRYWWEYMKMVEILLQFTRAQRDGNWELHLCAFRSMLPFFMRYNHTNYARWGTIYLNEMHQLPPEVKEEFSKGNFVVKRVKKSFNQVDPDQSQEWLNGTGKKGGGIIGITKTPTALSRWALSYNLRSHMASDTKKVYSMQTDDVYVHNEASRGRQRQDSADEDKLFGTFVALKMFSQEVPDNLQNIASKDLASNEIEHDLLSAKEKGQKQLENFVAERLLPQEHRKTKFRDPLPKNKPLTFASLFEFRTLKSGPSKEKAIKADRKVFQRLITAYEAGRHVNLDDILCHELLPVPSALAEMNGNLRTGSKAILSQVLVADTPCPPTLDTENLPDDATLIIDGQALVIAIGKPQGASNFGDLADAFVASVLQSGASFHRIDVLFDRYYEVSIKSATRNKRSQGSRPIRRPIEGREVPLPSRWENFLAHPENKADLARFLSHQLVLGAPQNKIIVVAGGFGNEEMVEASSPTVETEKLEARHEEADTRVIIHCIECKASAIVVAARDTDILVLLLAYFHKMPCTNLWLKAGTAKKRKYIPIHSIVENLQLSQDMLETLPAFHALTGSDTTSYIAGHSKKSSWKVFLQYSDLLSNLGKLDLTPETTRDAQHFVCKMYGIQNTHSANKARSLLFVKSRAPESLPPTSDALTLHIQRAHYQAAVWRQAHKQHPVLPPPEQMGWKLEDNALVPILMTLPAIPESCLELISCNCTTSCRTVRCKCRKTRLACTAACKCRSVEDSCFNDL